MKASSSNRHARPALPLGAFLSLALVALAGLLPSQASLAQSVPDPETRVGIPSDRDGDGINNDVDADDDNDLVADIDEPTGDADGDGVPNGFDTDADNDGIADLVEAIADPALLRLLDANNDGLLDEGVVLGPNGMADLAETSPESGTYTTGRVDADADGIRDPYDLDSDNDGIADLVEAGGSDADGNARVDRFRDFDDDGRDDQLSLFPIVPRDTDDDGVLDFRDLDSDNDGASDRRESSGVDTDNDGVVDGFVDLDGDGLDDGVAAAPVMALDSGGDSRPDYLDANTTLAGSDGSTSGGAAGTQENSNTSVNGARDGGLPITGRAGNALGGCSIDTVGRGTSSSAHDPVLMLLLLVASGVLVSSARRRRLAVGMVVVATAGCSSLEPPLRTFGVDSYHAGAGVGASRLDADLSDTGFVADERSSVSAQVTVGASLTPWLDAELRAADLGALTLTDGEEIGYQVADLSAVLRQRRGALTFFGRGGVGALFNDGGVDVERRNDLHLLLGAGADLTLSNNWRLRVEASGHDVDALNADIGVLYRFGRTGRERLPGIQVATADSTPTPTPAPAPAPAPAPTPAPESIPESVPEAALESTAESTAESAPSLEAAPSPESAPASEPTLAAAPAPGPSDAPEADTVISPREGLLVGPSIPRVRVEFGQLADVAEPASSGTSSALLIGPRRDTLPVAPSDPSSDVRREISPEVSPEVSPEISSEPSPDRTPGNVAEPPLSVAQTTPFDASDYDFRFVEGSDRLTRESQLEIQTLARALEASPSTRLTIVARSATGDGPQAELLSRRRALAVVRALGGEGIEGARLRPEVQTPAEADPDSERDIDSVTLVERGSSGG